MYKEEWFLETHTNWRAFDVRKELARTIYNRVKERHNGVHYTWKIMWSDKEGEELTFEDVKNDELQKFYAILDLMYEDFNTEEDFLFLCNK